MREPGQVDEQPVELGGGGVRFCERRRLASVARAELGQRRLQLLEEAGQLLERPRRPACWRGADRAVRPASSMNR